MKITPTPKPLPTLISQAASQLVRVEERKKEEQKKQEKRNLIRIA